MMKKIFIDTSSNSFIKVGLITESFEEIIQEEIGKQKSQVVLPLINSLLIKHALTLEEVEAIDVVNGPGSFTGIRVGIAITNTLGTFLKIPINNRKIGELVEARYT